MDRATFGFLQEPFDDALALDSAEDRRSQIAMWSELINHEMAMIHAVLPASPLIAVLVGIRGEFDTRSQIGTADSSALYALVRPIDPSGLKRFVDRLTAQDAWAFDRQKLATALVAQLFYELKYLITGYSVKGAIPVPGDMQLDSATALAIGAETASYAHWSQMVEQTDEIEYQAIAVQAEARGQIADIINDANKRLSDLNGVVIDLQQKDKRLRDAIDAAIAEYKTGYETAETRVTSIERQAANIAADLSTTEENISSFRDAVKTEFGIDYVRKLWDQRAIESRDAWQYSAAALVVFLLIIPGFALYYLDSVIAALRHIGDATIEGLPKDIGAAELTIVTITRLVVITIPFGLYFWVIRLIVRFNTRSLILMDDARQRHTMMDTFFNLIAKNAAVKEDRALILNALFRPTPGQTDAVDPPNFVDLLQKGMGKD